jgi:para-nitrobenzyl esterase
MLRKVTIETGVVEGLPAADPRITSFKGIPFAAPPVGRNRWRAPQPAAAWSGVFKAFEFGPAAMQLIPGLNRDDLYSREWNVDPEIPMSEDCLQLNVWTPANAADEKLPVYVWYYGGGLRVGNPAEMEFDGERLARRGIVVVSLNYRVNAFGFLAHPEITAEAPDAPANFGHLDQQFGTRWVKRNIAAFGGDPNNITIGGQSAGGMSVAAQMVSPQNEGLFQKAIIESGLFMSPYGVLEIQLALADAEARGERFFAKLGVKTLAEARALDAAVIRDAAQSRDEVWATVSDGRFQVGFYSQELLKKRWQVPLLVGRTIDERSPGFKQNFKSMDEFQKAAERFGDRAEAFKALCHAAEGLDTVNEYSALDKLKFGAHCLCTSEDRAGSTAPKYYYVFGPHIPGWDNAGAFHSCDLWFWFETLAKCWRPFNGKHYDLARKMCNYWANFIRSGDPNGVDADGTPLPRWTPYTAKAPAAMLLNEEEGRTGMVGEEPDELFRLQMESVIGR